MQINQTLINEGADITATAADGTTALRIAKNNNRAAVMILLTKAGARD